MENELTSNIAPLARAWLDAKRAENEANAARLKIEAQMQGALEIPQEGSKTHKVDGFKITVTQPVTRKLDEAEWAKVQVYCPAEYRPIKTKIEADATGCKWLVENEPKLWALISGAFETKPGKVGFKVENVSNGD